MPISMGYLLKLAHGLARQTTHVDVIQTCSIDDLSLAVEMPDQPLGPAGALSDVPDR
jgi:hypothetical protein